MCTNPPAYPGKGIRFQHHSKCILVSLVGDEVDVGLDIDPCRAGACAWRTEREFNRITFISTPQFYRAPRKYLPYIHFPHGGSTSFEQMYGFAEYFVVYRVRRNHLMLNKELVEVFSLYAFSVLWSYVKSNGIFYTRPPIPNICFIHMKFITINIWQ